MSKRSAFTLMLFGLFCLAISGYRAATTPWTPRDIAAPAVLPPADSVRDDVARLRAEITPVWNKVNPPDVTRPVIESAGPGGHVTLKLANVQSAENIDNVQVYFDVGAALPDGSVKWVRSHVASIVLESAPQNGATLAFDVTPYFTFLLSHDPTELRNFTVEFVQVPKNHSVKQTDQSFNVGWTYLEITDAHGRPVPQPKREPRYG